MNRLGTALHVVSKRLIVRNDPGDPVPRINSNVVDAKKTNIGRVSDIFGPVGRPYVVVRTGRGVDAAKHVGKKLYFDDSSWRDRKWKR